MAKVEERAKTVVDIARKNKNFSTLVKAIRSVGLVNTLKGEGPFTVFAPTNAAFDRLPKNQREGLFEAKNKSRLSDILQHHVVKGRRMAKAVRERSSLTPMKGGSLHVEKKGDTVKIGMATIQQADLEAENGVIHVIDRVLMP